MPDKTPPASAYYGPAVQRGDPVLGVLERAVPDLDVGGITPLNKHLQAQARSVIKTIALIQKLQDHVLDEPCLDKTQIVAACKLLDKVVSNAPTELSGPDGKPLAIGAASREEIYRDMLRALAIEARAEQSDAQALEHKQ